VRCLELCSSAFRSEPIAVVFSLLGYFVSMIMVLTAAVGVMIGLSNFSTSENVHHYQRPAVERNFTKTNNEPHLFMSVRDAKDGPPAKNIETNPTAVPDKQADAKRSKPHRPKVLARQRNNYERPSYGNALGYAEYTRSGSRGPFFNW
jgi:hypothetical protein